MFDGNQESASGSTPDLSSTHSSRRLAQKATWVGAGANISLATIKLTGGLLLGSRALIADAVDSLGDLVSDVITLIAVQVSRKPIDENHPYGHGRIESLASMIIGGILIFAATMMAINAVRGLIAGELREISAVGLIIAGLSIVTKETLFRWTLSVGRKIRSRVVESNAWHHRSDALSSLAVFAGLGIGLAVPGADSFDAVASLIVTIFIARTGVRIAVNSMHDLVDTEQDPKLLAQCEKIALQVPMVVNAHRIRSRRYGPHIWLDIDIEVDPDMTVAHAHDIAHETKELILKEIAFIADVQVHIEPVGSHLNGEGTVRGM